MQTLVGSSIRTQFFYRHTPNNALGTQGDKMQTLGYKSRFPLFLIRYRIVTIRSLLSGGRTSVSLHLPTHVRIASIRTRFFYRHTPNSALGTQGDKMQTQEYKLNITVSLIPDTISTFVSLHLPTRVRIALIRTRFFYLHTPKNALGTQRDDICDREYGIRITVSLILDTISYRRNSRSLL